MSPAGCFIYRKVSIFIKEGTNVFIQDSTAFFINVTQVSVSTYNQNSISQGMATITTTDTIVEGLSKKAVFHLMKDLTLDIGSVVSYGNFSDAEMGSIGRGGDTFQCVRTSLGISKIVARIIAKTTTSGVFIYLLYLQQKEIKLTDVEFHVTGTVLYTKDPCNVHLENLFMNTYRG